MPAFFVGQTIVKIDDFISNNEIAIINDLRKTA